MRKSDPLLEALGERAVALADSGRRCSSDLSWSELFRQAGKLVAYYPYLWLSSKPVGEEAPGVLPRV